MAASVKRNLGSMHQQGVPNALRPTGYDPHRPHLPPQHHARNTDLPSRTLQARERVNAEWRQRIVGLLDDEGV
jgi:hypothetical protein